MSDQAQNDSASQTNSAAPDGSNQNPADLVSEEWRKRILSEKKKVQEERDLLRAEKEERERKDLEAKGEYQKLLELAKAEADAAKNRLREIEEERLQGKKAAALLKALDNSLPDKFYGFLNLDDVIIDPSTGEINQLSVTKAAEQFKTNYPELLIKRDGPRLPNNAPQGAGKLTREEWLKLPVDEMKKRRKELVD